MSEYVNHPAYAKLHARFPGVKLDGGGMTPLQGRVVFHQERIFRSTGGGQVAHTRYVKLCTIARLPNVITDMTPADCVHALYLIQRAAHWAGLGGFRDIATQWEVFA